MTYTLLDRLQRRRSWYVSSMLSVLLGASLAGSAVADTQRLQLKTGWNLVSLAIDPVDPSPAAVFAPLGANLRSVWAYDQVTGSWTRFPQAAAGLPVLDQLRPGRGYWVEVGAAANVDLVGIDAALPGGPGEIVTGWNLIGFPLLQPAAYDRVLADASIREIWTFENSQFQGVVIDTAGLVVREDFLEMKPGRGYWVRSVQPTSLAPILKTTLPADIDVPPLFLQDPPVDAEVSWTSISVGDVDVGRDGLYDRALTQRAVDFDVRVMQQQLVVTNWGSGVLRYRVAVNDADGECSWLRFQVRDPQTGAIELVTEVEGAVLTERDFLTLAALRADRAPGNYDCGFTLVSNGVLPPELPTPTASIRAVEPVRNYQAFMTVGGLEGDYRLRVVIDTIDGKPADLANPRIGLSLYQDAGGLKAIIDSESTLLFPTNVPLAGRIIQSDTTRFEASGSLVMPQGSPGNPFATNVRRDVTLRGVRGDRAGLGGPSLLSPDLEGQYFETVRNLTGQPIQLVGTFTGERLSTIPTARDRVQTQDPGAVGLPDDGELTRTITITERLLIDEVDITTNLVHSRPTDVVVSLIGPDGTEVVLRDRSPEDLGTQVFDELHEPLQSLGVFDGTLATGTWTLRVQDTAPGVTGNLLGWSLDIRGTKVYDIAGSVCLAYPVGSPIFLTGCGRTEITFAPVDRQFLFRDLIPCVYQVQVRASGWQVAAQDVVVTNQNETASLCVLSAGPPTVPNPITLPQSAQGRFTSLTTAGGAGIAQRSSPPIPLEQLYGLDAATWDLDRAPLGSTSPGLEDTNAFLNIANPLTKSNQVGTNTALDGPVGANSTRVFVTLGMPVIGRSVQGDLVLTVGGNP